MPDRQQRLKRHHDFVVFDEVAGAYGGELDRLLALGGSDASATTNPDEGKSRFPPVVRFYGPFTLKAGEKQTQEVELPQYVGARIYSCLLQASASGLKTPCVGARHCSPEHRE